MPPIARYSAFTRLNMPSKVIGVGFGDAMAAGMPLSSISLTADGEPNIAMISPLASALRAAESAEWNIAT